MKDSWRSSEIQNDFRTVVAARDSLCLLSEAEFEDCAACHILPRSRPEVCGSLHVTFDHSFDPTLANVASSFAILSAQYYEEVLGDEANHLFQGQYGLLLRHDLHHSFDRGDWALHDDGENLIVHVFNASLSALQYHGKVISPDRFRGKPFRYPNRDLLRFHYQQCSMKRFRGFSAGF